MERRDFLIGLGLVLLVPTAVTAVAGCSNSSTSSTPADSFTVDSSLDTGPGGYSHRHTVVVLLADLANPPAAGISYLTNSAEGHSHQVTFSNSALADIQEGKTRSESTTVVLGHSHSFAVRKP